MDALHEFISGLAKNEDPKLPTSSNRNIPIANEGGNFSDEDEEEEDDDYVSDVSSVPDEDEAEANAIYNKTAKKSASSKGESFMSKRDAKIELLCSEMWSVPNCNVALFAECQFVPVCMIYEKLRQNVVTEVKKQLKKCSNCLKEYSGSKCPDQKCDAVEFNPEEDEDKVVNCSKEVQHQSPGVLSQNDSIVEEQKSSKSIVASCVDGYAPSEQCDKHLHTAINNKCKKVKVNVQNVLVMHNAPGKT